MELVLPIKERIIEILKDNYCILHILDYFSTDNVSFVFISDNDVDLCLKNDNWETVLPIIIDSDFYDEKFSDVNKYEVEDMGLKFSIFTGGEPHEFTIENIWRHLLFNKETITSIR